MVSAEAGGSRKGKVAYSGGLVLEPQAPESRPRAENSPGFAELFMLIPKLERRFAVAQAMLECKRFRAQFIDAHVLS